MKAVRFHPTIPRYAAGLSLGKLSNSILWSGLSCTSYDEVPDLELPGDEWVIIKTRYGGICGSDMSAIHLSGSPYFTPFMSFPYTFGHENVGRIARLGRNVAGFEGGDRIVVEPTLWCRPRGFPDLCRFCQRGEINRCERITQGDISAGMMTGFCRDTSGSWSEYFLAHQSQLYMLPDEIDDENGLMIEPFAVGLHAVINNLPEEKQLILVVGAGTIGLCTTASLRLLNPNCEIHVLARHQFQAEAALKLGADRVISASKDHDVYEQISDITGAQLLTPILGKRVLHGGYDQVYECVGSDNSLDDSIRLTRSGGEVILVGVPGISKHVDWSGIFGQELTLKAAYIYNHAEDYSGKKWSAFDLVIKFMLEGKVDIGWMVTHKYKLDQYPQALKLQSHRSEHQVIRTVFEFD